MTQALSDRRRIGTLTCLSSNAAQFPYSEMAGKSTLISGCSYARQLDGAQFPCSLKHLRPTLRDTLEFISRRNQFIITELKHTDALIIAKWRETWRISWRKMQLPLLEIESQDSQHSTVIKRATPEQRW